MREACGALGKGFGTDQALAEKRVTELSKRKAELDDRIFAVRRQLSPIRQTHADAVRRSLHMRSAIALLGDCSDQITNSGGCLDWSKPFMPNTGTLEDYARRIIEGQA